MPVVVVDDWSDTYRVPAGLDRAFDPGPAWVLPAGIAAGFALMVATSSSRATSTWLVLASLAFAGSVALVALSPDRARVESRLYAVATAAWIVGAWNLASRASLGLQVAVALVGVGVVGQVVAVARLRRVALARRNALRAPVDAVRADASVVALAGMPWERAATITATDGSGRTWLAEHRSWRALRPAVGDPVAVWSTATDGAVVALISHRRAG